MTRLRAVIVDWAGTLIDHGSCAPARAFVEVFRRHRVDISDAEARGPMGMGKRDHVAAIARGRGLPDAAIDTIYAELVPVLVEILPRHAAPIAGAAEALAAWRAAGLKVGSTTGYGREMMDVILPAARAAGVAPDCVVSVSDVRAGRPAPWMALEAAARLGVYPMRAIVKIGDTVADIEEGLNAGMWTIGITATGNELGLDAEEAAALPDEERRRRLDAAAVRLRAAGAHAVAASVAECGPVLEELDLRLERGERP